MADPRLIVVDADINKRLATELDFRGRRARSLASFQLHGSLDDVVLTRLNDRLEVPWVLLTGDDHMPFDHGELIDELGVTIATVDRRNPAGVLPDTYRRDVGHRWAHVIAEQPAGTVRRYSLGSHRAWTVPRGW